MWPLCLHMQHALKITSSSVQTSRFITLSTTLLFSHQPLIFCHFLVVHIVQTVMMQFTVVIKYGIPFKTLSSKFIVLTFWLHQTIINFALKNLHVHEDVLKWRLFYFRIWTQHLKLVCIFEYTQVWVSKYNTLKVIYITDLINTIMFNWLFIQ